MKKKREKMELVPGTRYRGWGVVNDYGQFDFTPEATGTREGTIKQVCQRDGVTVSHTKNHIIVHIKMRKLVNLTQYMGEVWNKFSTAINILREYEI